MLNNKCSQIGSRTVLNNSFQTHIVKTTLYSPVRKSWDIHKNCCVKMQIFFGRIQSQMLIIFVYILIICSVAKINCHETIFTGQSWNIIITVNKSCFTVYKYWLQGLKVTLIIWAPEGQNIARHVEEGNIYRPEGANLINVARKHSQNLFCYMKKQTKNEENFENKLPLFSQLNIEFMSSILHPVHLIKISLALNGLWWYSTMFIMTHMY